MLKGILVKKDIPFYVLLLLLFLMLTPLFFESIGRCLILLLLLLIFLLFYLFTKDILYSFLVFLLLSLPFNITYQIPQIFLEKLNFLYSSSYVNGILVNYLVPTLSILDMGVVIFLLNFLLMGKIPTIQKVFLKYKLAIFLFSIALLLQNIFLHNILVLLTSFRFLLYLVTFLVVIEKLKDSNIFKIQKKSFTLSLLLFFSVLVQGIIGLLQFKGGVSLGLRFLGESQVVAGMIGTSFVTLDGEIFLRMYGTFPHPNLLAGFFLLSFFISILLLRNFEGKWKAFSLLTILLITVFVPFTFSRIAIFLFGISLFVFLIQFLLPRVKKSFLSFSPIYLLYRFTDILRDGNESLRDRTNLAKSSFAIIKENFWTGTGLGNFVGEMGESIPRTGKGILLLQPVHNIFLLLFSELGVFTFLSLGYLLFEIMRKNIKRITVYGLLVIFSLGIIGSFDHYLVSLPQGLMMFWLFIFLLLSESKYLNKDKQ